jgi:hypothetical protein
MDRPILFNTEMVQAILAGRKTQTRRLCKIRSIIDFRPIDHAKCMTVEFPKRNYKGPCANFLDKKGEYLGAAQTPAQPGDTLWVRETWCRWWLPHGEWSYCYKATSPNGNMAPTSPDPEDEWFVMPWKPSIHMPREAARLFLKVTAVRTERLQDITMDEIRKEGLVPSCAMCYFNAAQKTGEIECTKGVVTSADCGLENLFPDLGFRGLWNSTIKEADLPRYGWDANPWVWVIEFERMEAQP